MSFLSSEDKVKQLKQDKAYNLAFLQEEFQIGPQQIDALYNFAKFQFECGNYSGAAEFLYHYRHAPCYSMHCSALCGPLIQEHATEVLFAIITSGRWPPTASGC